MNDGAVSPYLPLELDSIATWGKANGFGGSGDGPDDFTFPTGTALSPDETELYVLDTGNGRIKAMSLDGTVLRTWDHPNVPCSGFGSGIAVAADGTIYVADDTIHGIVGYSPDGTRRYAWPFDRADPFCDSNYPGHAHDVIIASDGSVVATEGGVGEVQVFTPNGVLIRHFGVRGSGKGQFSSGPHGIAELNERFYVVGSHEVLIFAQDGSYLGLVPPLLNLDDPVAYGGGQLIAAWRGWLFFGPQVYSPDPTIIFAQAPGFERFTNRWETANGVLPGQLSVAWDLAITTNGRWYVTEAYNYRVQVFHAILTTP